MNLRAATQDDPIAGVAAPAGTAVQVPIDELPFGLVIVDAQGHVVHANRQVAGWLRRPGASLIGAPFVSLLDAGSAWLWEMFALPRLSLTGSLEGVAVTCASATGAGCPLVASARACELDSGKGYRIALVDGAMQREQTRRGAAAAARANRLARVVEYANEPVVLVDEHLRIVAHNPATVRYLGRSADELVGQALDAFVAPSERPQDDLGTVIRSQARGGSTDAEFRFPVGAGTVRSAMIKATALHASAESDPAYGVFLIDTTERRRLEALNVAMREAEVAARERRDVLSRISHEFLTPLNAVLGFTRVAMDDEAVGAASPLRHRLEQVHAAGRQLVSLVDAVLGLTREGGLELMAPTRVSLGVLLQRCAAGAAAQAREEGVGVRIVCADADAEVTVPLIQVEQCLASLVSNAIRYNERGGAVQVRARVRAGRLLLQVIDDGPGLQPGSLQRAFLPFERLDAEHRGIEGVGLGLAVTRSILARMGGVLRARSRPHRATIFTAELPAHVGGATATPGASVAPGTPAVGTRAGSGAPAYPVAAYGTTRDAHAGSAADASVDAGDSGRFTVLLAESSPFARMLVEMAFAERPDWQLVVAADADALRAQCARHRPDVLLVETAIVRAMGPDGLRSVAAMPGAARARIVLVGDADAARDDAPRDGADATMDDASQAVDRLPRPLSMPVLMERLSAWAREPRATACEDLSARGASARAASTGPRAT